MKQALIGASVFVVFAVMSWGSWLFYNDLKCSDAEAFIKQIELCNQHRGCITHITMEDAGNYIDAMAIREACMADAIKIVEILQR